MSGEQAAEIADESMVILIAEADAMAVGYATLARATVAEGIAGTRPMELKRIYAVKEWIGRGIGAALMQAALQEAQERGHERLHHTDLLCQWQF